MRAIIACLSFLTLGMLGCQSEEFSRYHAREDGFSVRELDGWRVSREKGTVLFRETAEASHTTIAIRAVTLDQPDRETRTRQSFLQSTEKVLRSFPEAVVRGPAPIDGNRDQMAFEVDFVPESKGTRYRRRHVVVFESRHVFQLWHTAPAGDLEKTSATFAELVDSIREEV